MQEILTLIQSNGFAVVAAVGCFLAFYKMVQDDKAAQEKRESAHLEQMKAYTEAAKETAATIAEVKEQLKANSDRLKRLEDSVDALQ